MNNEDLQNYIASRISTLTIMNKNMDFLDMMAVCEDIINQIEISAAEYND